MLGKWNPSTAHLILFAVGGGLVYLGEDWGVPGATQVGIGVLGVLAAVIGMDIVIKRLGIFRVDGWSNLVDAYRGVLELLWGLVFICLGLLILAVVAVPWFAPGGVGDFWSGTLLSSTGVGVLLSVVGLMTVLNGLIRALAGSGRVNARRLGGLAGVVDRSGGVLTLVFGAVLSMIGLVLLVAPGWLEAGVKAVFGLAR
jgi:hypothetical protein